MKETKNLQKVKAERVYIHKQTGDLYLWTNMTLNWLSYWVFQIRENDYLISTRDELEYLGEL
jgi:hypothetical protein